MLAATAIAVLAAADAKAAYYKMVACAHTNGAPPFSIDTNTRSSANPSGIFHIWNFCDGQGGDPPGDGSFFRIQEHQNMPNTAGENAYGNFIFDTPSNVHFKQAGGYTRQSSFHDGWRSRFWVASCCSVAQIVSQGKGVSGSGTTSTFAAHLWPFGGVLWDFNRFVFELRCVRPGRCDVSGDVRTDLNGLVFLLSDDSDSRVDFTKTSSDFLAGKWVKGTHSVTFDVRDQGSGIRAERMLIDGALRWNRDHSCSTSSTGQNGEWARSYNPCPTGGPWGRSVGLDTATLADGAHAVRLCTEDYGQYQGLQGTKGETCTQRTVRTDNTAPGRPAALQVTSKNPNRYLDRFGAQWTLPPDSGSPIKRVHYDVIDSQGKVVVAERTVSGTNPASLAEIHGPERRGAYWMRVWLEDEVGNVGPAAGVEVPRDTTPPAAPQELAVAASSTERWVERFGLRWRNIVDAGASINKAHYQVLDGAGEVVVATRTVSERNAQELRDLSSPSRRGDYVVRVWLTDEEGNVGAAARVPLPRDTTPPAAPQGVSVAPPDASRAAEGFDLRWRNIVDGGAPIVAAHYKVLNASGGAAVPTTTVTGEGIERIADLEAPRARGDYTLLLWLSDAEGNVGAPVQAPLSYGCVRSEVAGGTVLSAGLGRRQTPAQRVPQGRGSTLAGSLRGPAGAVSGAPVCVFGTVLTGGVREFLGVALSGADGDYRFAVAPGPSRTIEAVYRPGQRRIGASATLHTRVRPTLKAKRRVVRNKRFARFHGRIPGPNNDRVVIVLQVKQGKGWRTFRRYRTREGGRYRLIYRFGRTTSPATYLMRAQVRRQGDYPYLPGNSKVLRLRVMP